MTMTIDHAQLAGDLAGCWAIWPQYLSSLQTILNRSVGPSNARAHAAPAMRGSIAVVGVNGVLTKRQSWFSGTDYEHLAAAIATAATDPAVEGIMLRIESPGGAGAGIIELLDQIRAVRHTKPVHAYAEDLAASAAYGIAAQASVISAGPAALVGSIGSYAAILDLSSMASNIGIKVHVVRAGKFKGAAHPGTPITDEQLADFQRVVNGLNAVFLAGIASGRGVAVSRIEQLADGRVHVGREAQQLGLVDHIESFEQALARLRTTISSTTAGGTRAAATPPGRAAAPPVSDPIATFNAAVETLVKGGADRREAVAQVVKENPQLHQQYLVATNSRSFRMRGHVERLVARGMSRQHAEQRVADAWNGGRRA